jgi:hypothetical protein
LEAVTDPRPQPGLVIRYSYLWRSELLKGREEGVKDRPCAIVFALRVEDKKDERVWVVPITHSRPPNIDEAVELPIATKRRLGLDDDGAWVILSETNVFIWPGPDVRRVGDRGNESIVYGQLPPEFFSFLRKKLLALLKQRRVRMVPRTE